ncbi:MAG: hypothetical protein INH41_05330 [Myxococcaceae bacterium]|nr:hypothetical protein [Myxococcaceae bacterium]MCA3011807.1 hypothetical protein [Myxococcaceae bacterium]
MTTALALALVVTAAPEGPHDVYAVVVGHNGGRLAGPGRAALADLRFADDDALRMARWFEALAVPGGVTVLARPDGQTRATLDAAGLPLPAVLAPTRRALFEALEALKQTLARRARPSTVFFFYAGHGLTGRLLLEPEAGDEASLTGRELRLALLDLGATHVELFIDACRSQSLFTERGGPDLSKEIATLEAGASPTTLGILTAAQSETPAGEASDLMGGFFSHVLASGLAGAADADGDEVVRFGELAAFVAFNTEGLTGQRPWFEPPSQDLGAPVVALSGTTRLELPGEAEGRLRVVSEAGAPIVAELFKPRGRRMALTLPSGEYRVQRRDGAAKVARVALVAGQSRTLGPLLDDDGAPRAAGRGDLVWEPVSFQAPFSPQVVAALDAGYVSGRPAAPSPARRGLVVDAAYVGAPTPFGLPGLEHGVEAGARLSFGGPQAGVRVAFRMAPVPSTQAPDAVLRRVAVNVRGGWRFGLFGQRLGLTPFATAGFKTVWRTAQGKVAGDAFAPAMGAGLQAEGHVASWLSLWLEGRFEATWVSLDGARTAFPEPGVTMGASVWF